MSVNIDGLSKAAVLAALYNASNPQGMGFMRFDASAMSEATAQGILNDITERSPRQVYFDYLQGRVMKIDLTSDTEFDPWGYDRDNGQGAAQRAVDALRRSGDTGGDSPVSPMNDDEKARLARDTEKAIFVTTF